MGMGAYRIGAAGGAVQRYPEGWMTESSELRPRIHFWHSTLRS